MCDPFEDRDPDLLFPLATEPDAVPNSAEACSKFSGWGKEGRKEGGREKARHSVDFHSAQALWWDILAK